MPKYLSKVEKQNMMIVRTFFFDADFYFTHETAYERKIRDIFGRSLDYARKGSELFDRNCLLPGGFNRCFEVCSDDLLNMNQKLDCLEFLSGGRRKQVLTLAKIQPFCISVNLDYGYYIGRETSLRCTKE